MHCVHDTYQAVDANSWFPSLCHEKTGSGVLISGAWGMSHEDFMDSELNIQ